MKIYGIVTDAAEEKPLAKSKVVLYIGEIELVTFYSDKDGKFQIEQKLDQHIGETLICHVEKDNFNPREVTYKIGDEDIRLDIELVPIEREKPVELPKEEIVPPSPPPPETTPKPPRAEPSNKKWLKIAIGIAAVIVVAIGAYFVISHERRPEPVHRPALRPAPRPGEVRVPQRASVAPLPDLYISEFSLSPSTPTQSKPVKVRVGVYNRGSAKAKPFTVEWWAGENFPRPAKVWRVDGLAAKGGRILTYKYDGYPSWYGKLTTKAVADSKGKVKEQNEQNNVRKMEIRVRKK